MYVTEHVAVAVLPDSVQLAAGVNVLVATVLVKLTLPVGLMNAPGEVSVTVAVQLVPWLTATVEGEHATLRVTVLLVTVTLAVLGPLPEWAVSPPYVPLIVWVPVPMTVGVYVTEHLPALRVHVVLLKVPVPLLVKVTVPVGVIGVPAALVSATVAVHDVTLFTTIVAGAQAIVVLDVLRFTVMFDAALVLLA